MTCFSGEGGRVSGECSVTAYGEDLTSADIYDSRSMGMRPSSTSCLPYLRSPTMVISDVMVHATSEARRLSTSDAELQRACLSFRRPNILGMSHSRPDAMTS